MERSSRTLLNDRFVPKHTGSTMQKKKALFVIKEMHMGGSRKSLCSLLNALSTDEHLDLYLLNMSSTGELLEEVPESVTVLESTAPMKAYFAGKDEISFVLLLLKAFLRLLYRFKLGDRILKYLISSWYKENPIEYDAVIGGQEGTSDEAALIIPGKKHIIWFHCDYDKYCTLVDETNKEPIYSQADNIVFVSEKSKSAFSSKYPNLTDKCIVIRNIIDRKEIIDKAERIPAYRYRGKGLKIVSVGRISGEKGFDRISKIVKRLQEYNINLEWIIIGGGDLLGQLQVQIRENKQEDCIHFIGQVTNPYPVVKQADLYVMTSHFEAQPLVLIEALILGIPVISTDFSSVREVISEGENYGAIVDNSVEGISEGILEIVKKDAIPDMKRAALNYRYDNSEIITSVERLLI